MTPTEVEQTARQLVSELLALLDWLEAVMEEEDRR